MSKTNIDVRDADVTCPSSHCREVADSLALIGDKWTVMVVAALSTCIVMRYNEIHRAVDGVSQRMLTLTLKKLEQDGLITRTMYPTIPPRVDYALTDLGQNLVVPLRALYDWAELHRPEMLAARTSFTARESEEKRLRAALFAPK